MAQTKTGSVYYRDINGILWLCESFVDENGVVTTTETQVTEN